MCVANDKKQASLTRKDIEQFIRTCILQRGRFRRLVVRRSQEAKLLSRIQRRDQQAMRTFYKQYHIQLGRALKPFFRNESEIEDLVQELFLQIWEKASSFDLSKGDVYSWLITLARNRAIDKTRSRQYQRRDNQRQNISPDSLPTSDDNSPLDQILRGERNARLRDALKRLPVSQRELICLAYWEGYTHEEIRNRFHLPLGTVKTRIRQGLKKLQLMLYRQEYDE